ncbi:MULTISPECIES: hypothetical protein [Pelosinus]|uniref:Uncharacterized protein n=1 Tax=Pelosinus fermentans B4 TaxID=1149862 RepID=I8RDK9_9FIRM|nr:MULTISPECIES: hypothetical protein [Pelosinus]EIW17318.1 hypothetical protein FB4_4067 [Pelosinus fermentans B4]EIW23377.1 hypothetical protein FA11_4069 [Pelosinus fermentans A11]OAM96487.1 hypothetical protein FR7_04511 [Pelosinus fermentans DSM 17108]SDR40686.1 hypothetical protein SAMN04515679_4693 [Pelosinus fermentans]
MNSSSNKEPRHPKGLVSTISINLVHLRNPWIIAFWSAMLPGFGHVSLGSYIHGFLLILWELIINMNGNINYAILYSFTGRYDMAIEVVDNRWLLLYVPVYIWSIWSSYRQSVDLNKMSILADRERSPISPSKISTLEICFLDKKIPWVSLWWSLLMPGIGHLYTHRLPTGFLVLGWWIVICYYSNAVQAVQFTALGEYNNAIAVINPQWILFLPSTYGFSLYDGYVNTVEYNRLYDQEQARYLEDNFQDTAFEMPV